MKNLYVVAMLAATLAVGTAEPASAQSASSESCASIEQALPQASKAFKPDGNGNWWIGQGHFAADVPPAVSHFMAIS